jgi:uncharacterized protein (TIGR03643 family)
MIKRFVFFEKRIFFLFLKRLLETVVLKTLTPEQTNRIIEMAWEDRTTFDAIKQQFGMAEQEVIALMRKEMKPSSFRMWRERVQGRKTKHAALRNFVEGRHKCNLQRTITNNKISKR